MLDVNNRRLVNPFLQWLGARIMLRRTCKQTMAGVDRNLAVCFLEHSYIRGLKDFMYSSSDLYNLRLDRDSYNVTTKFRRGLQVQQLASIAHFGRDVPDICFCKSEEMTLVRLPMTRLCLTSYPSRLIYCTVSVCRWSSSANYCDATHWWSIPNTTTPLST